jgi:hypothetical protein
MRKPSRLVWFSTALALGAAGESPADGPDDLALRRDAWLGELRGRGDAPPFAVETREGDRAARGDVYALLRHGHRRVAGALSAAPSWCEIAPLHLNVKSCTYRLGDPVDRLTLYNGRKHYEPPEDAHALHAELRVTAAERDYFRVVLHAPEGPLGTRDTRIEIEAIPAGEDLAFVHLAYTTRIGWGARAALAGYFATLGSGKVGFSVVGSDRKGGPIYVDGMAGMVERNAVRYQLAIEAYLDTLGAPPAQRFERRIARWYHLTERHPRQLFELPRSDYLEIKRRERGDQHRLQRELSGDALSP